jgi:hypothetical protein
MTDKADTDYSKDEFQGCNHYGVFSSGTHDKGQEFMKTSGPKKIATMADSESYAVSSGKAGYAEARMRCLSCGEMNLNTMYNYCPNCGRKFKR